MELFVVPGVRPLEGMCDARQRAGATDASTRCFFLFHHTLHHPHPLGRRRFGLMRQPGVLDQDACRRSGQRTDAGIWPARHVCAGRVAKVPHACGNEA